MQKSSEAVEHRKTMKGPGEDVKQNLWISIVSALITKLETSASDFNSAGADVSVSHKFDKVHGAISVLRPCAEGGRYLICLFFGNAKWCELGSMNVHFLRCTFETDSNKEYCSSDLSCSCAMYQIHDQCVHISAVRDNNTN